MGAPNISVLSGRSGSHLAFVMEGISFIQIETLFAHAHVFFHFTDGSTLVYEDVRKFGTMEVLVPVLVDNYFFMKDWSRADRSGFKEPVSSS